MRKTEQKKRDIKVKKWREEHIDAKEKEENIKETEGKNENKRDRKREKRKKGLR